MASARNMVDTSREDPLVGYHFAIEVQGVGLRLYLVPGPHGVQILRRIEGASPVAEAANRPAAGAQAAGGGAADAADRIEEPGARHSGAILRGQNRRGLHHRDGEFLEELLGHLRVAAQHAQEAEVVAAQFA